MDSENHACPIQFKHFDVVPEARDHYFISEITKKKLDNRKSYAKIMREWKILENNLPEGIYVQVYETRIDLLRAVIIGASGTPYHDGLFFFDILLPSNYPVQPPSVYYHSHGYRLNPNLYKSGKVCLSLINTWGGDKTEMWTKNSSILQVLVSIQGLVLNERPFFNEPGTYMTPRLKSASNKYNDEVFIMSCKTMLHIMKKPPQNFEDFIDQHFRLRAASILAAIQNYQKGNMMVGHFEMKGSSSDVKVCDEFRTNLNTIYSELKTAFAFGSVIPDAGIEKIEKMENEEASSSTLKIGLKTAFAFGSVIPEAGIEKIEKMENEEASSSTLRTEKTVKKWKLLKYASRTRKAKENVEQKKDGIWKRIVRYAKKILK